MAKVEVRTSMYATRELILQVLKADGPSTSAEIAETVGKTVASIRGSIHVMRKRHPKLLHIAGWKRYVGTGGYYASIWSLGPGKDAPEPVIDPKERRHRWREKNSALLRAKDHASRGAVNPFLQLIPKR